MKTNILLTALFLTTSSFALNIDEAIEKAIENNYSLQKQNYILDEKNANVDLQYGAYHPKLDLSYNYVANKEAISTQKDYSSASATISYNLFNGFSDKYNIQSAVLEKQSTQYLVNAAKLDLIYATKTAYVNYLMSKKLIDTLEIAHKLYQQQYSDALHKFDQGLLAKNDLLQINTQLLQSKQDLQKATSDAKINRLKLSNILSGTLDENELIEDLPQINVVLENLDSSTLDQRSEILALEDVIDSLDASKKAAQGNYYPKVNSTLSYTKYGDNATLEVAPEAFEDQQTAMLNLSWNLYNGQKDLAQTKIIQSKKMQYNSDLQDLKLAIQLQYETAREQYNVANLNLETATIALEQADENYKIVNNRFQEGLSSTTDLLNANYLLSQSKQNFDNAYYNKYLSYSALKRILAK